MKKYNLITSFIFILPVISIAFIACSKDDKCDKPMEIAALINFYKVVNDTVYTVNFNQFSLYGIDNDSIIYNNEDTINHINVPLNHLNNSCSFVIKIGSVSDTIDFNYRRDLDYISNECGFTTTFTLNDIEVSNNIVDSFKIVNRIINASESEDIKMFF